jgi:glycosyltransferase involved in cell wall biosynthesis
MPKIIIFLPSLAGGGAERVMLHLSDGLAKRGIAVDLVVSQLSGEYVSEIPENINVINLNNSRLSLSFFKFAKYLRKNPKSVVLTTLQYSNIFCLIVKKVFFLKNKIVIRESNAISKKFNGTTIKSKIFLGLIRWLYPSSDKIIAVSQGIKDELHYFLDIDSELITVIPNPVKLPMCGPVLGNSCSHLWLREGEPPLILGVGRLVKQKDFATLIRAFSLVVEHVESRLIILGEGPEINDLRKLASDLGVEDNVDFPGFDPDPFSYMKRAKVFVLSSLWEGFPNALIQALACNCAVISTNCSYGPAEILADGKYGKLVEIGDYKDMAKQIIDTLKSKESLKNGNFWFQKYNFDKILSQYQEVI